MGTVSLMSLIYTSSIPANRPNFIGIVPIYNFQNGQKSGRPNFFLLIFF